MYNNIKKNVITKLKRR